MIALVRVDNRLIHGQVVEAWIPAFHISRVLIADDAAATSTLTRAAMALAVPATVKVEVAPMAAADFPAAATSPERTLVLVREVADAMRAHERSLAFHSLNLGNVHYAPGRVQVSPSVFLSTVELDALQRLSESGVTIDVRAVPNDRSLALADIEGRLSAQTHPPARATDPRS